TAAAARTAAATTCPATPITASSPFDGFSGPGVYAADLALLDEKGHLDYGARLQFGRLGAAADGVAPDAGGRLHHFQFHGSGQLGADDPAVHHGDFHYGVFLQEVDALAQDVGRQADLIVSFRIHEVVLAVGAVQVLHGPGVDAGAGQPLTGPESPADHGARFHVADLGPDEGGAAGLLDVLGFQHHMDGPVQDEDGAVAKIIGGNHGFPSPIYPPHRPSRLRAGPTGRAAAQGRPRRMVSE